MMELIEKWIADNIRTIAIVGFATAVLVFAGLGFVYKMTEFSATIIRDDIEGFGATAIAVYLTGVVPLFFLTLWAILTGRFRDIERPKYRVVELHEKLDAEARSQFHG
jgi:hypothetical protein